MHLKPSYTSFILLFLCFTLTELPIQANNLKISNVRLTSQNTTAGLNNPANSTLIQFDIQWDNSWRTSTTEPYNWDATWVFIKFRTRPSGDWQHARIDTLGFTAPSGATIEVPSDRMGCFVYRDADGTGSVNWAGVSLRWLYVQDGLTDDALIDIDVQGIEMVYVTEGPFYLGSGGDSPGEFQEGGHGEGYDHPAYYVSTPDSIVIGPDSNQLWSYSDPNYWDYAGDSINSGNGGPGTLYENFPNGYNAFYCMKYEISQGQYAHFLNMILPSQALIRFADKYNFPGHYIRRWNNLYVAERPDWACNFLSWGDGIAYADWAGIRPMTELEYEKACRGPKNPVRNEYAWGTSSTHWGDYFHNAEETLLTNPPTNKGNMNFSGSRGLDGPWRCGIFAASAVNKTRQETGATYYGAMEMSGNLYERAISVGRARGRFFTDMHGNGSISTAGEADVSSWPKNLTSDWGAGVRGGGWIGLYDDTRVSQRHDASHHNLSRTSDVGWRGVRSAP